jgi:SAM-dependent methyltransferase
MSHDQDMWGTGDYQAVAEKVTSIADVLVQRAGIEPGMEVLDVACGTGNASIPAAKLGARVTGLDFSPGLIAIARERGAEAKVGVDWLKVMPSRSHLTTTASTASSPRTGICLRPIKRTGDELLRVCRPDGHIAVACWTPEGSIGSMFERLGAISPAPPEGFQPPVLWGTEDHVRELLGDSVEFERHNVEFDEPSPESYADFMLTGFPPLIALRAQLGDELVRDVLGVGQRRQRGRRRVTALQR